jgi:hypothetical protein
VLVLGFGLSLGQASALGLPGAMELAIILLVVFPMLLAWIVGLSAVGDTSGHPSTRTPNPRVVTAAPLVSNADLDAGVMGRLGSGYRADRQSGTPGLTG